MNQAEATNESALDMNLKGVPLTKLIIEYQNQNGKLSYSELERAFLIVKSKTINQFRSEKKRKSHQV